MERLQPRSTVNARASGLKSFTKFLESEQVDVDYAKSCFRKDTSGQCFAAVMEKFALYLASYQKTPGVPLSKTVDYHRPSDFQVPEVAGAMIIHCQARMARAFNCAPKITSCRHPAWVSGITCKEANMCSSTLSVTRGKGHVPVILKAHSAA
jgi:hypothetical protein